MRRMFPRQTATAKTLSALLLVTTLTLGAQGRVTIRAPWESPTDGLRALKKGGGGGGREDSDPYAGKWSLVSVFGKVGGGDVDGVVESATARTPVVGLNGDDLRELPLLPADQDEGPRLRLVPLDRGNGDGDAVGVNSNGTITTFTTEGTGRKYKLTIRLGNGNRVSTTVEVVGKSDDGIYDLITVGKIRSSMKEGAAESSNELEAYILSSLPTLSQMTVEEDVAGVARLVMKGPSVRWDGLRPTPRGANRKGGSARRDRRYLGQWNMTRAFAGPELGEFPLNGTAVTLMFERDEDALAEMKPGSNAYRLSVQVGGGDTLSATVRVVGRQDGFDMIEVGNVSSTRQDEQRRELSEVEKYISTSLPTLYKMTVSRRSKQLLMIGPEAEWNCDHSGGDVDDGDGSGSGNLLDSGNSPGDHDDEYMGKWNLTQVFTGPELGGLAFPPGVDVVLNFSNKESVPSVDSTNGTNATYYIYDLSVHVIGGNSLSSTITIVGESGGFDLIEVGQVRSTNRQSSSDLEAVETYLSSALSSFTKMIVSNGQLIMSEPENEWICDRPPVTNGVSNTSNRKGGAGRRKKRRANMYVGKWNLTQVSLAPDESETAALSEIDMLDHAVYLIFKRPKNTYKNSTRLNTYDLSVRLARRWFVSTTVEIVGKNEDGLDLIEVGDVSSPSPKRKKKLSSSLVGVEEYVVMSLATFESIDVDDEGQQLTLSGPNVMWTSERHFGRLDM